ncbi:MAG: SprT-like domain-containing protein [Tepidisphaeraceae bacterium]
MNLYEAGHLARELMRRHGLLGQGWTFSFDHARRRFGCCHYHTKRITLSRPLTFLNAIDEVRDTVLHEIAHALTPGDGHGRKWRAKCAQIGATPRRCYKDEEIVAPPRAAAKYLLGCEACGWWVERRRRSRRKYVCKRCSGSVEYRARPRVLTS